MPAHSADNQKRLARNALLCILMSVLAIGGIAYVIVRDAILEELNGKHNLLAHRNTCEEFVVFAFFLVVPFIGGCSAFRLARSTERFTKIIGWLLLVMFSLFFLQSVAVCWNQYVRG